MKAWRLIAGGCLALGLVVTGTVGAQQATRRATGESAAAEPAAAPKWQLGLLRGGQGKLGRARNAGVTRVEITQGGTSALAVQLYQRGVAIEAGVTYGVKFLARADSPRTIALAVLEGQRPWGSLGLEETYSLTNKWKEFRATFTATGGDVGAAVRFGLGGNTAAVEIYNFSLEAGGGSVPIVRADTRKADFQLNPINGAEAKLELPADRKQDVVVTVAEGGKAVTDVQLWFRRFPLRANDRYIVRFKAKGNAARTISFSVMQAQEPWSGLGLVKDVELSTEWQEVTTDFAASDAADKAMLRFALGGSAGIVELSSVSIEPASADPRYLQWRLTLGGDGKADVLFPADNPDAVAARISSAGAKPWDVQLFRACDAVKQDGRYLVRFRARAAKPRPVNLSVMKSEPPFDVLGLYKDLELMASWQDFAEEFTASADEAKPAVRFALGGDASAVEVDGLTIEPAVWSLTAAPKAAQLKYSGADSRQIRVEIAEPGKDAYGVQLFRPGLEVAERERYTLSFRARAAAARPMIVSVQKREAPWTALGLYRELKLTTEWQRFDFEFTSGADETNAAVMLGLGGAEAGVDLAGFHFGLAEWELSHDDATEASLSFTDAEPPVAQVTVGKAGDKPWQVLLGRMRVDVTEGKRYVVRYRARAEKASQITATVVQGTAPFDALGMYATPEVGPEWKAYREEFTAKASDAKALLRFGLGAAAGRFEIADVSVEPAVWSLSTDGETTAKLGAPATAADGLRVEITKAGTKPWQVQLNRLDVPVQADGRYTVRFRARADKPRSMTASLVNPDAPEEPQGFYQEVALTTEWQSFFADFVAKSSTEKAMVRLSLGGSEAAVEIADFVAEPAAWSVARAEGTEARVAISTDDPPVVKVELPKPGKDPWNVQLQRLNQAVEAGKRYALRFRARAAEPRTVVCAVVGGQAPFDPLGMLETFELKTSWQEYRADFAASASDGSAIVQFSLGGQAATVEISDVALEISAWSLSTDGDAQARLTVPRGRPHTARVEFDQPGSEPWQVQLIRPGMAVEGEQRYALRFRARASGQRSLVCLLTPEANQDSMGLEATFQITPEWRTYRADFAATASDPTACARFYLGGSPQTVEIENVELGPSEWNLSTSGLARAELGVPVNEPEGIRVEIREPGDEPWQIALERLHVPIEGQTRYELRFRARADQARELVCSVVQGVPPGDPLGLYQAVTLAAEWRSYRVEFLAQDTDPEANIRFAVGGSPHSVEIADVNVGASNWDLAFEEPQSATLLVPDPAAQAVRVEIKEPGTHAWDIQLRRLHEAVVGQTPYVVRFRAKAARPRSLTVSVVQGSPPGDALGLIRTFDLSSEWQDCQAEFLASTTDPDAALQFSVGGSPHAVDLSDLSLAESAWLLDRASTADAHLQLLGTAEKQTARVTLVKPGEQPTDVKLDRFGIAVDEGEHYDVRFRARSAQAREIGVALLTKSEVAESLGLEETFSLDRNWKFCRAHFVARKTDTQGLLRFALGGDRAAVDLTQVVVVASEWLLTVAEGATAEVHDEGMAPDRPAQVTIGQPGKQPDDVMLKKLHLAVQEQDRYVLRFRARAAEPREVMVQVAELEGSGQTLGLKQACKLGTEWQDFQLPFIATSSDAQAVACFGLGGNSEAVAVMGVAVERSEWTLNLAAAAEGVLQFPEGPTGPAQVELAKGGEKPWDAQLLKAGPALDSSRRFRVRFRVRAQKPRTINVAVMQAHAPWESLGWNKEIAVTDDWTTVDEDFSPMTSDERVALRFALGGADKTVELRDVSLAETDWWMSHEPEAQVELQRDHRQQDAVSVKIAEPGTKPWSIHLYHRAPIEADAHYVFRCRARAAKLRRVDFAIVQRQSPWQNLGLSDSVELSNEWRDVRSDFTARASDTLAVLRIALGGNATGVELAGVSLERVADDSPLAVWQLDRRAESEAHLEVAPDAPNILRVAIENGGEAAWDVKVQQPRLPIRAAEDYDFRFRARATAPHRINYVLVRTADVHQNMGLSGAAELTTDWQEYATRFTSRAGDDNATLYFSLGGAPVDVELADVSFALHVEEESSEGGSGDPRRESWRVTHVADAAAKLVLPEDRPDVVRVEIAKPGSTRWGVQLSQYGLKIEYRETYTVSFLARADRARSVTCAIAQSYEPWRGLGFYQQLQLKPEWQSFRFEFQGKASDERARLHFDVGVSNVAVELQNVSVRSNSKREVAQAAERRTRGRVSMATLIGLSVWGGLLMLTLIGPIRRRIFGRKMPIRRLPPRTGVATRGMSQGKPPGGVSPAASTNVPVLPTTEDDLKTEGGMEQVDVT